MSDPSYYTPGYSYTGWEGINPTKPKPGPELDSDFANVSLSVNQTVDALKDVRRSDGKLKNKIVTPDSLASDTLLGIRNPTTWATGQPYGANDTVFAGSGSSIGVYRAVVAHTSGVFATDLAAGKWARVFDLAPTTPVYPTITGMASVEVPVGITGIRVNGSITEGDGLGGFYVDTNNGSSDTFISGGLTTRTWYRSVADRALGKRAYAGTGIYANEIPGASSRYDANSSFKANTFAGKNLLLGAAAKDGTTWVEAYMPGDDAAGRTVNYAVAAGHGYTVVNALRASDFPGSTPDFLITDAAVMVANHTTVAHTHWNRYDHGIITATGLFAQFYNDEKSLQNLAASAASLDPWNAVVGGNRARVAGNLHLTSGINAGVPSNLISFAIDVTANGGKYRRAIVIAADALDTSSGNADALAMALNHSVTWYKSDGAGAGSPIWKMFNNDGTGTLSQIILGKNVLWVAAADIAITSGNKIGLTPTASKWLRYNGGLGRFELGSTTSGVDTIIANWPG